jgi:hypothetical protein
MTQSTQFLMVKGSAAMNVLADDLATYQADDWQIVNIRYSEGGEGVDTTSLVLVTKGADAIYIRAGSVAAYINNGYQVVKVLYGEDQIPIPLQDNNLVFLDTPAFVSAEIGTVADTTLVVTFSTEVASEDFTAGVTIKINTVAQVIESATRQSDHTVVHYVIPAVIFGDTVTWAYDDLTGGIASANDGSILDDVTTQTATNNVLEE